MQTLRAVSMAVITMFILLCAQSYAQRACSNKTAKGTYGYSCNGSVGGQPFAAYGVVTGDGRGQWDGHGKVSFNGAIHAWTHKTRPAEPSIVDADCTGRITYEVTLDDSPFPDAHFDFAVVDSGREIKGFPTDPGFAVTCQLKLVRSDD